MCDRKSNKRQAEKAHAAKILHLVGIWCRSELLSAHFKTIKRNHNNNPRSSSLIIVYLKVGQVPNVKYKQDVPEKTKHYTAG